MTIIDTINEIARLLTPSGTHAAVYIHDLPVDDLKAAAQLPGARFESKFQTDSGPPSFYDTVSVRVIETSFGLFSQHRLASDDEILTYLKEKRR